MITTPKIRNTAFYYFLSVLFLFSPFLTQRNMGGLGLALPYNIPVWASASWVIATGIALVANNKLIHLPRSWIFLCAFPITIIVTSLVTGSAHPISWFFRELYILGGLAFLFALFQFNPKQKTIDNTLLIIVVATFLHAIFGSLQTFALAKDLSVLSHLNNGWSPKNIFQQINVQASFIATGAIVIIYSISRPSFKAKGALINAFMTLAFALSMLVIAAAGSRVGLLSIIIGIPLILICRMHQLKSKKRLLIAFLITGVISFYMGASGLQKTIDKGANLASDPYANARISIYKIGSEAVKEKPLGGHGIGGFQKAWNKHAASFYAQHPEANIPRNVTHPHNELLFWAIESGIPSMLAILITIASIGAAIVKCGFQRGGAYAAMLIPITIHTQVELPFYTSSFHWFLWIFLIFLPLRHQVKTASTNLSAAATKLIYAVALVVAISSSTFMYNTHSALGHMTGFMLHEESMEALQPGLENLYFKREAENIVMITSLISSVRSNNLEKVENFKQWATNYIKHSPEPRMYELLTIASKALNPEGKGCDAAKIALSTYPYNKNIQKTYEACKTQEELPPA